MTIDLSLETARQMVVACEQQAAEIGIQVASCVVDSGGNAILFARMDGTQLASSRIAYGKAYSALAWRRPSGDLWSIAQPGEGGFGINTIDPRFVLAAGGVPLYDGQRIIGAIGVSGGHADQDHECALAGVEALAESHRQRKEA
jgi:uncharacterized protein GlcG (DUF336 family)